MLFTLVQDRGLARAAAIGRGALVGPSQVGGRILEMLFGRKAHPVWSLLATATAPMVGAWLLEWVGLTRAPVVLCGAALLLIARVLPLVRMALRSGSGS